MATTQTAILRGEFLGSRPQSGGVVLQLLHTVPRDLDPSSLCEGMRDDQRNSTVQDLPNEDTSLGPQLGHLH